MSEIKRGNIYFNDVTNHAVHLTMQVLMDMEVNESNWTTTILTVMQSNIYNVAQRAKKVVSDSPGLVDFPIGLVNSVFNFPDGQVMFFEEFEQQKNCEINSARQKASGAS